MAPALGYRHDGSVRVAGAPAKVYRRVTGYSAREELEAGLLGVVGMPDRPTEAWVKLPAFEDHLL
jgi:hypothetical protein